MGYHIIWGTYGTRLHGSSKPHVDREHNEYGTPFAPTDPEREEASLDRMKNAPIYLTIEQRKTVERAIQDVCDRYRWVLHEKAAQRDHVHTVITACREGEALRDALKAVASRALNARFGKNKWWAEKGSAKYLWERRYFENAKRYVRDQRDF